MSGYVKTRDYSYIFDGTVIMLYYINSNTVLYILYKLVLIYSYDIVLYQITKEQHVIKINSKKFENPTG